MKNILVIDGNSIINRAFYGIRALSTKDGRPTNAIYGMLNIVLRHLEQIKPDYAAVAFDLKTPPNFRKVRFSYYKEGRHETPEELLAQFPDAKECLRLLGLHTLELGGYEADDLLGTVSAFAEVEEDVHAYVLSGDRDLLQLISPRVTVLLATTGDTVAFDRDAFFAKYGIEPSEFIDLKALMGDSSDNISGVPGIGEKTAITLISAFHSLEGVYENIESPTITRGVREKLIAGREAAYDSRWLATICREAPLGLSLADLTFAGMDCAGLYRKCMDLELTQLVRKLKLSPTARETEGGIPCAVCAAPEDGGACGAEEAEPVKTDDFPTYYNIEADALLSRLPAGASFAVSLREDGVYLADKDGAMKYEGDLAAIAPLFDGSRRVTVYDGKKLLHALFAAGIKTDLVPRDVMLYAYVLDSADGTSAPATLAVRYLGLYPQEDAPDAHILLALETVLAERIAEAGCEALLEEIELPLSPVLARMEEKGFRIDREALEAFGVSLAEQIADYTENIYALAGGEFNINSPKQLAEVLFDKLMLPTKGLKKNKNGYSTDVDTLNSLRYAHPIVDEILAFRQVSKLYSTYAVGLCKVADETGRIHTDFKQALTATGRLSSAEPNLQNIPIRTKLGREMRRCFVPENGDYVFVDADYSQIELRLLAAFSGDANMIDAFLSGADIHARTAAAVFRVPEGAVTDELRKRAKAVNFGIVYGISAYSLSGDIGVSVAEAKRYMEGYFAEYPGIRAYLDGVVANAEETGYTETCLGRKRYIPELKSKIFAQRAFGKRVAMNSPIQGSAADIIKIAMVRTDARLRREKPDAHLVMQVHDELIVECPAADAEDVRRILTEEMQGAISLEVPLTVSTGVGGNWLEAEH